MRAMVFIAEQKVPASWSSDEDDKTAEHFISFGRKGTWSRAAARLLDNGRIGRVAVLRPSAARRHRRGRDEDCPRAREGARHETCTSPHRCRPRCRYERLGFEPFGDEFDEAGIPHRMMRLVF